MDNTYSEATMDTSQLWDFSVIGKIHQNIDLIHNNHNGQFMVRRISPTDTYDVLKLMTRIRHKNLMAVYDVVKKDGVCVSICEFINGTTLQHTVEHTGVYTVDRVKNIMCQICDGLYVLHSNNIVHRDIKPENIMTDGKGNIKIIDFDITRIIKSQQNQDTNILGTIGYASPEQFGFSQTTHKADIYSCGVLMNYLLTARLPNEQCYEGNLTPIIRKCIEIDETKRFQDITALKTAIIWERITDEERNFRPLPGFRSKRIFPKIITTFFIAQWVLFFFICVSRFIPSLSESEWDKQTYHNIVMWINVLFFWSSIPYILFGDVFRLSEKIYPKNLTKSRYIEKALGFASLIFGMVLLSF